VAIPDDGRRETDAAGGHQRPDEVERPVDDLAGLDRLERDRGFARLDSREIEDLVDEPEQMPAALEDVLDRVALPNVDVCDTLPITGIIRPILVIGTSTWKSVGVANRRDKDHEL